MVWSMSMLATFAPDNEIGKDLLQDYTVGWSEFWSENVKDVFDHSYEVRLGDCVDFNGDLVECDSGSDAYRVLNSFRILESNIPKDLDRTRLLMFPSSEVLEKYAAKCSLKASSTFHPSKDSWEDGDRRYLCVRGIDEEESDITQSYIFSRVNPGVCLNDEGIGVQCDSNSAEFYILKALTIVSSEGSNEYPNDSTLRAYDEKCPSDTEFVFSPTRKRWSVGDRNFMCVRRK